MKLKDGVSLAGLGASMTLAMEIVERCYADLSLDCWITSGTERTSTHHGQPVEGGMEDPHYEGKALDFRMWNVAPALRPGLVKKIRAELGPDYVVLRESPGLSNEHVHIQSGKISAV